MSSFYYPIDLSNAFVTVYPIGTHTGSYGWFGASMWQIWGVFLQLCVIYVWINNYYTIPILVFMFFYHNFIFIFSLHPRFKTNTDQREKGEGERFLAVPSKILPQLSIGGALIWVDSIKCVWSLGVLRSAAGPWRGVFQAQSLSICLSANERLKTTLMNTMYRPKTECKSMHECSWAFVLNWR